MLQTFLDKNGVQGLHICNTNNYLLDFLCQKPTGLPPGLTEIYV